MSAMGRKQTLPHCPQLVESGYNIEVILSPALLDRERVNAVGHAEAIGDTSVQLEAHPQIHAEGYFHGGAGVKAHQ